MKTVYLVTAHCTPHTIAAVRPTNPQMADLMAAGPAVQQPYATKRSADKLHAALVATGMYTVTFAEKRAFESIEEAFMHVTGLCPAEGASCPAEERAA